MCFHKRIYILIWPYIAEKFRVVVDVMFSRIILIYYFFVFKYRALEQL